jgi:hypothetical protein
MLDIIADPKPATQSERLRNGLEEELIDLHAVDAELQEVEGLRDALTIVRRSPEWPQPRAINAVAVLINQVHDAVSRTRFAMDGHPEPCDERHPAVLSISRLNGEAIAALPDDERKWLVEECTRVLSCVAGSHADSKMIEYGRERWTPLPTLDTTVGYWTNICSAAVNRLLVGDQTAARTLVVELDRAHTLAKTIADIKQLQQQMELGRALAGVALKRISDAIMMEPQPGERPARAKPAKRRAAR